MSDPAGGRSAPVVAEVDVDVDVEVEVEVEVGMADAEWAADLLWGAGVTAIEERLAPGGAGVVLVTGPDSPALRAVLAGRWPVRRRAVDDAVLDAWKAWAAPVAVGRLVVVPAWLALDGGGGQVADGRVVVRLDAGRTFGHGGHPTTRAVLDQLARRVEPGSIVLDVGCGSGVLAVAAAALGAARVTAIDIDPLAVATTTANAEANGVADRIDASTTPLTELPASTPAGRFDLVVANLGAGPLIDLAHPLAARVATGGTVEGEPTGEPDHRTRCSSRRGPTPTARHGSTSSLPALVLSGLLVDRRDEVVAAYPGWKVDAEVVDDGWCTLTMERRGVNR